MEEERKEDEDDVPSGQIAPQPRLTQEPQGIFLSQRSLRLEERRWDGVVCCDEETDRLHSAHDRRVAPFLRFFEGSAKRLGSMRMEGGRGSVEEEEVVEEEDGAMECPEGIEGFPRVALVISISINEIISFLG